MFDHQPVNIAVLVSGRGSNLQALIEAVPKISNAKLALVISNKTDAYALTRAKDAGISTEVVLANKGEPRETYDQRVISILQRNRIDLVVLAGFMRILSPLFIKTFQNKLINIHPSLLPAFPGLDVQQKAIDYGAKFSGCTVHFVDEGCDTGPIIMQSVVPVLPSDDAHTLSERILKEEHKLLPKVVDLFCQNKIKVLGRKVVIEGN